MPEKGKRGGGKLGGWGGGGMEGAVGGGWVGGCFGGEGARSLGVGGFFIK